MSVKAAGIGMLAYACLLYLIALCSPILTILIFVAECIDE